MEEFQAEEGYSDEEELPQKWQRVEMFCNHCDRWVSKSTYYRHRRDYGSGDSQADSVKESDFENKSEVFTACEELFENVDGVDESKQ